MKENRPKVGVGIFIVKDGKILIGKRIGKHGHNTWAPPGGHLEFGESFEDCAKRETLEEVGLKIKNPKFIKLTNDIHKNENKHYITIFMITDEFDGEVKAMEPDKATDWDWYDWNDLPKPLFLNIQYLKDIDFNPINYLKEK